MIFLRPNSSEASLLFLGTYCEHCRCLKCIISVIADYNPIQMSISQLIAHSTFVGLSNTPIMLLVLAIVFAVFMTADCDNVSDVLAQVELKMTEMTETINKLEASLLNHFSVNQILHFYI